MKKPEDTQTMDLTLPAPDGLDPADPDGWGKIARALAGLPPAPPKAPALPAWRVVLNDAITASPSGKKGVAERLGVSRPYVSRVTTGNLQHCVPPKFIARVIAVLMRVDCPHLQRPLPPADCRSYADRSYAQVSSFEVDHWRACRGCPNNARRKFELAAAQRAQARKASTGSGAGTAVTTATATAIATATQGAPA